MDDKNLELIPDKDGFLFEIEDHSYLLHNFCMWFALTSLIIFILFYFKNGDILALKNSGYHGNILVTVGGYCIVVGAIGISIYIVRNKKEKIQFYTNYIYRTSNKLKVPLDNVEEGYIAKYNTFSNEIPWRISTFSFTLGILLGNFIILFLIILGRFVYSIFKGKRYTIETNNLLLLQKNYNKYCISIALNIASKEDIEKVNLYLNQYLNTDIEKMERIFYKIPEFKRSNL
ncbi:hypothetical protein [Aliarcobacter butzleri]|uniref:hypothetical protein n=1 Tax=Aliarcobacter butzleri TaxID=28197 RepID=UPI00186A5D93|nr:hypothetical protein [Aliarcobacter butzleri]MCG3692472.1 hypothetical protein [Aliarcobacter butzleri]